MFDIFDDLNEDSYSSAGPNIPEAMDCMRCGICLNSCPTYALTHDEQESPRQRIRTLSRLLVERQEVGTGAIQHLQSCVQCRACETVCPSQMDYHELFDQAQQQLADAGKQNLYARLALSLVAHKKRFKALLPGVKFYQLSGLRWLFRKTALLKSMGLYQADRLAPLPALSSLRTRYPATGEQKGRIGLFTGCVSEHFDRQTLLSAIKVLTRLGYDVHVPAHQVCCGAIHYHNDEQATANSLMQQNLDCFNALDVDAVIYCATGCGSQLQEYPVLLEEGQQALRPGLYEICEFINAHWPDSLMLKPSNKVVAVHEACSQRNVLNNQQAMYQMLARIPGLNVQSLADNHLCCGAGGSYMLTHPENAQVLCDMKWQHIEASGADFVVSANIGCALHLTSAKPTASVQLMHPVELFARHLYAQSA